MIEKVADALAERPDLTGDHDERWSRDELRAEALGWLAHPEDVIALLAGTYPSRGQHVPEDAPEDAPGAEPEPDRSTARSRAVVHVHVADAAIRAALGGTICGSCGSIAAAPEGVARVEEFGPMLLDQLARLLAHARIELKPVIDLNENRSVNGYEHPPDVHERSFLRATGDVFRTPRPSPAASTATTPTPPNATDHPVRPWMPTTPH